MVAMSNHTETNTELQVVAVVQARPGSEQAVSLAASELAEPSLREPDNRAYVAYGVAGDPSRVVFVERWTDRPAFERHLQTAHMQTFLAAADERFAAPPEVMFLEPLGGHR